MSSLTDTGRTYTQRPLLVSTSTTSATALNALNNMFFLLFRIAIAQVFLWNSADTHTLVIPVSRLKTLKTAEPLISRLLPLSDEYSVSVLVLETELVTLS